MSLAGKLPVTRSTGKSKLGPEEQLPGDALTQLRALGPLGISPGTDGLQQQDDPFASALVQHAFTDAPVASLGKLGFVNQWCMPSCWHCADATKCHAAALGQSSVEGRSCQTQTVSRMWAEFDEPHEPGPCSVYYATCLHTSRACTACFNACGEKSLAQHE